MSADGDTPPDLPYGSEAPRPSSPLGRHAAHVDVVGDVDFRPFTMR